jgi:hypothetical protein
VYRSSTGVVQGYRSSTGVQLYRSVTGVQGYRYSTGIVGGTGVQDKYNYAMDAGEVQRIRGPGVVQV